MKRPYYTSNSLIEAVKRKMSFPIAQNTFSNEEILLFADEELFLAQVPSIIQYHEEYFVHVEEVPLVQRQSRYPIPHRAIGMKLRDIFYKDTGGQLIEMSRVSPDDKSFFETDTNINPTPIHYYLQNNSIILTPAVTDNVSGTLVFSYYLRPNALVPDERAAISQSFSKTVTVSNTGLVAGNTINFGSFSAVAGTNFAIGVNDATTANNLTNYISGLVNSGFGATVTSNIITITYSDRTAKFSSTNPASLAIQSTITVNTTAVPSDITAGTLVDILQTDGGHTTLDFDVLLAPSSVSPNSITLSEAQLPDDFVVGDYICAQYECIIPQIPTDLHNLLAERTCARIMEALGDREGLQTANQKIQELEFRQATIIDSRVEGSPQKVLNRNGLLRQNRIAFGRRG